MRTVSARGVVAGALIMAAALDIESTRMTDFPVWPTLLVVMVGLTAVLWPAARRPTWLTVQVRTVVPALFSALFTAASALSGRTVPFGPGEVLILLCLLAIAVRQCPPRWALVCALLDGGAVLALPARRYGSLGPDAQGVLLVGLILVCFTAGLAGYLRALDYRRTVAVSETRRAERLAIAADLHDFVAHHVTGILVQSQVARMMTTTRPDELDQVLGDIEHAATEALASMRRTVGVLRDAGPDAARRPVGDLAAIADLTHGFAVPGQKITLDRDPALPADLPHEVQAAAFRVVQEALTNVRRHASDADEIRVALRGDDRRLQVSVTDDGRGRTRLPDAARGGGFGLVGLAERVTALSGELHAGPLPEHGWEVRAVFPVEKA
ncbi:histidine kinase [Streptomyces sp. NEAU-H22]|uniref:sensor histidine kinase n=1 Tax=Streptomyces sp. NEAU-H22 TaxID=2994655 RepID=UPI002255BE5A|nr:histidine kinase [Streptomyces sp. NEAU-H22]MCX3290374.1 histidine kinase [Streptomyces sp. NEAU-H22]